MCLSSACDVLEMSVVRGVCGICDMCLARGGRCWGEWVRGLGLGFTNPRGTGGKWGLCFGCGGGGEGGGLVASGEGGVVLSMCLLRVWIICVDEVQVSVYCARRIPAHLSCTQCLILLHLIDIYFITCICLWQIS